MRNLPFDALLCDIDGVLRIWNPADMSGLDRAYGLPGGTLAKAAFRPERLVPAITGAVTDEEWRSAVTADLAGVCGSMPTARALIDEWGTVPARVDEEVRALLTTVRRQLPVVLVSNATTRLESDLARLGLSDVADAVVNTARIGVAKPDPQVYRTAAERAGVHPSRCLSVDDTLENVTAAGSLGMSGLHYQRIQQLQDALAPLLGTRPA